MMNTFLLRCTLLSVRAAYYLLPIIKWLGKVLFWCLIALVIFLLLLVII